MKTIKYLKICLPLIAVIASTETLLANSQEIGSKLIELSRPPQVQRISSYQQIFLNSDFRDAQIFVDSGASESRIKYLISKQLRYLNGQLRMQNAQAEVAQAQIDILDKGSRDGRHRLVSYRFRTRISWDRARQIPDSIEMIFPAYAEGSGHEHFYSNFGSHCSDEKPTLENFFYHYAPLNSNCPLRDSNYNDNSLVFRTRGKLTLSSENTSNKYPEYARVWQDRKLIVTVLFSKNERRSTSNDDVGIHAYNRTYTKLLQMFGTPTYISEYFNGVPSAARPTLELHFQSSRGPLIIYMRLVSHLSSEDASFVDWYQSKTPQSDLILYNGHAGLGDNASRLAKIGKFTEGQYQIIFINGCTTFSYINKDIWRLHGAANPGYAPSKHLDVILNSLPSYFSENDDATLMMINSMIDARLNYQGILRNLDPAQRALVDGEEDNP